MDAALQDFLGSKPSMETPKPEPQPADTQELRRWYAASAASNDGHRWRNTRKLSSLFRPSKTASPYFLAAPRAMFLTASSACSESGG